MDKNRIYNVLIGEGEQHLDLRKLKLPAEVEMTIPLKGKGGGSVTLTFQVKLYCII